MARSTSFMISSHPSLVSGAFFGSIGRRYPGSTSGVTRRSLATSQLDDNLSSDVSCRRLPDVAEIVGDVVNHFLATTTKLSIVHARYARGRLWILFFHWIAAKRNKKRRELNSSNAWKRSLMRVERKFLPFASKALSMSWRNSI